MNNTRSNTIQTNNQTEWKNTVELNLGKDTTDS